MDGIQPYSGPTRAPALPTTNVDPTMVKTPSDYLRSLRRRIWLVLAIGVPLSVLAAVMAVRQPNVYRAWTEITIEPPRYDPVLSTLVSHEIGGRDPDFNAKYVPNLIAQLRSKVFAEQVLVDPAVAQPTDPGDDAAADLVNRLQTRQVPNSNRFQVSLEGTDPARTAKLLDTWLALFQREAKKETEDKNDASHKNAEDSLKKMKNELNQLNDKIYQILAHTTTIGPGGKSIVEERYLTQGTLLLHKKARLGEVQQQAWVSHLSPGVKDPTVRPIDRRLGDLESLREQLTGNMEMLRHRVRNFNSDPSVRTAATKLRQVMDTIEQYKASMPPEPVVVDPSEALVAQMREEIRADEETAKALLKELQESMPEHQKYLDYLEERDQKLGRIATMQEKLANFETLSQSQSQKSPVAIEGLIAEPSVPVRPNRFLNILMGLVVSFGLGIALVCLIEHLDHSVKVPEHLTMGLTLPLFGVIPRIRRTALVHRGGHLWTEGVPDSIEADAYRNLRASLIGSSAKHGPIATMLVTSAKAGEGKSTTALNLAATCARAGERTLLLDVDLRRPSLAGVFREDDDELNLGLVDVLRGDLRWQQAVARTDLPNLDFLPTGDTRDIPIEILGTTELRQLILALSRHYDRVILDGPAVLGLPDCRMLGAYVDAALLVVRSGSHGLRPLKRAKASLEQSNVFIAGLVFNGLSEDMENWSSYGPNTPYGYPEITGEARLPGRGRGLDSPPVEPLAALPVAGSA